MFADGCLNCSTGVTNIQSRAEMVLPVCLGLWYLRLDFGLGFTLSPSNLGVSQLFIALILEIRIVLSLINVSSESCP